MLLKSLKDPLQMRACEKIIQFPFSTVATEEKTAEELARIAERRREQGRKLQELAAKAREEKVRVDLYPLVVWNLIVIAQLQQREADLQALLSLRERRDEESKRDWAVR